MSWIRAYIVLLALAMAQTNRARYLWGRPGVVRGPNAFVLATVVSGFTWYFARQQINNFNDRQRELIRRVEQEETAENFKTNFEYHDPESWDCKKVNLDGVISDGRFFVKRNRGKQEGYMVLAPFVVNSANRDTYFKNEELYKAHTSNRKFIINLGWIPRSRKHLVYDSVETDAYGEETYTNREEALAKQKQDGLVRDPLSPDTTVPITNLTAYVRRGEAEDSLNGRVNWRNNYLYKWIDLNLLTRVFRVFNEQEGETVYLERTFKDADDAESYPIQASKETVIEDLKTQSRNFENTANRTKLGVSGLAFGVAAWMTFF